MQYMCARVRCAAIAAILSLAAVREAAAQWSATSFGVAEYDTKQTFMPLAGVSASPRGLGLKPLVALQAYHLSYDGGTSRTNVFAITPSAGLINEYNGGEVYATAGYEFSNSEVGGPVVSGVSGRGTVLNGGWDHWGTSGPWAYQALASYNFGSESSWERGRITHLLAQHGASSTRLGGEVAYMSGQGYSAWQPGGVVEWHMSRGQILILGAGPKIQNAGGSAMYFKVEGVLPLAR